MSYGRWALAWGLLLAICVAAQPAAQASSSSKEAHTAHSKSSKPASKRVTTTKKPASKSPTKSKSSTKTRAHTSTTAKKHAVSTARTCKIIKGKRHCTTTTTQHQSRLLTSPISPDSFNKPLVPDTGNNDSKAHAIPDRAYAIDGQTFFHQGRRIRIEGLSPANANAGDDHAKQRLQMALDSGAISIDQISIDDTGVANAVVKVNGRDLADILNSGK